MLADNDDSDYLDDENGQNDSNEDRESLKEKPLQDLSGRILIFQGQYRERELDINF